MFTDPLPSKNKQTQDPLPISKTKTKHPLYNPVLGISFWDLVFEIGEGVFRPRH